MRSLNPAYFLDSSLQPQKRTQASVIVPEAVQFHGWRSVATSSVFGQASGVGHLSL